VSILILFIGIRNAWDVVTYVGVELPSQRNAADASESGGER